MGIEKVCPWADFILLSEERTRTFNLVLQRHLLCQLSYLARQRGHCSKIEAFFKCEMLVVSSVFEQMNADGFIQRHNKNDAAVALQQVPEHDLRLIQQCRDQFFGYHG